MFHKGKPDEHARSTPPPPARAQAARGLVAYRALSDVAAKGAMFLVTVVAARRLSADAFGLFALATTLGWLVAVASDFGLQLHTARVVAQSPHQAQVVVRRWLRVRLLAGAVVLLVTVVALSAFATGADARRALMVTAIAYALFGLAEFFYYVFRGLGRSDLESTLTLIQRGVMLMLCGTALAWWPSPVGLGAALLTTSIVAAVMARTVAGRVAPPDEAGSGTEQPAPPTLREVAVQVAPIGAGIVLSALYFRIDVFLLSRWSGTAAVGLYSSVFRIVDALRLFPAAALAVALPDLCRATSFHMVARVGARLSASAAAVALILWVAAPVLIPALYGPAFAAAVPTFGVLLLALPLMALNYALTHQLIGWNGQRAYAALCASALVINLAANARWIPQLGIAGSAWATLVTELFVSLGCGAALLRARPDAAAIRAASGQVAVVP